MGNNSYMSKDILMKLDVHRFNSYLIYSLYKVMSPEGQFVEIKTIKGQYLLYSWNHWDKHWCTSQYHCQISWGFKFHEMASINY